MMAYQYNHQTKRSANFKIFPEMIYLLAALFLIGTETEGKEYASQWTKYVRLGDDINITDVPSEDCDINFNFFAETNGLDCTNASLVSPTDKCLFNYGYIMPPKCYGLAYMKGVIWKEHTTAPFTFCAEKECPESPFIVESGIISISTSTRSVNEAVATTTTTAKLISTTNPHKDAHSTTLETTININATLFTQELATWKIALIALCVPLVTLTLLLICHWKQVKALYKRCKRTGASPGDFPDEGVHMIGNSKSSRDCVSGKYTICEDWKIQPLTPNEDETFGRELKQMYCQMKKDVKTGSPLDPNTWMELDRIYTNLVLLLDNKQTKKRPLDYDELVDILEGQSSRLLISGEAGVGKTTLLGKLAYDWAMGRYLTDIKLLFLIPLRELARNKHLSIGEFIKNYIYDELQIDGPRIDEFIRTNAKEVTILFDGLDEHKINLKESNTDDALIKILRCEKFKFTHIVVTTRPWRAEQITTSVHLNRLYTLVEIEGFDQHNVAKYIRKFYCEDKDSANSLISFLENDSVVGVGRNVAPFPIFCNMLCCMWKNESRRKTIRKLQTFSQLIYEMVFFLREHSFSKGDQVESFRKYQKRCDDNLKLVGEVAFRGLLRKQLVFGKESFQSCMDALKLACDVGVLTQDTRLAPKHMRQTEHVQFKEEIQFPHKLLQECLAAIFLASQHEIAPAKFKTLLNELFVDYEDFRYLLFLTAAHDKAVGTSIMEALCQTVDDIDVLVDTAFECHDIDAIKPLVSVLRRQKSLTIDGYRCISHTISGYVYTMEACGQYDYPQTLRNETDTRPESAGAGIFSLPRLQILQLKSVRLDDNWFRGMVSVASGSQVKDLRHWGSKLGVTASREYARGIFSMPNLGSVTLMRVMLADEFFSTMAELSSQSQIKELRFGNAYLSETPSKKFAEGIFSMPNLQALTLLEMSLTDEFFSTMAELSPSSQITNLSLSLCSVPPSCELANGIVSIPHLQSLTLDGIELDELFTMTEILSQLHVQELRIGDCYISQHIIHTLLTLPRLHSVTLHAVKCRKPVKTSHETTPIVNKSVIALGVDAASIPSLCEWKLHVMCPSVKTLTLIANDSGGDLTDIPTDLRHFQHIKAFNVVAGRSVPPTVMHPTQFCQSVMTVCPHNSRLSMTDISLRNEIAAHVVRSMRNYRQLTDIQLFRCSTDTKVDELITDVLEEGRLSVIIEHGKPRVPSWWDS